MTMLYIDDRRIGNSVMFESCMVRRLGNAPSRQLGSGVTARLASLTNYRRVEKLLYCFAVP